MTSRFLIKFFAILSALQFMLAIIGFIGSKSNNPVTHAILGMGIGLYIIWIMFFGLITWRYRNSIRAIVLKIRLHWAIKFVAFCTLLALLEELIAVALTNTASWYGLSIAQAHITASGDYWDVISHHSVIVFVPFFLLWAWLLSRYDLSANQVFLLFGLNGTLLEMLSSGPQHIVEIGMWMFVYGLMIYLPAYSLPAYTLRKRHE